MAFQSRATNLVAGQSDDNQRYDTFLFDRGTGAVTLVSHNFYNSTITGDGNSWAGPLSADGAFMVFVSTSRDLTASHLSHDRPNTNDVFLYDRATGKVTLVSHRALMPMGHNQWGLRRRPVQ